MLSPRQMGLYMSFQQMLLAPIMRLPTARGVPQKKFKTGRLGFHDPLIRTFVSKVNGEIAVIDESIGATVLQ